MFDLLALLLHHLEIQSLLHLPRELIYFQLQQKARQFLLLREPPLRREQELLLPELLPLSPGQCNKYNITMRQKYGVLLLTNR